MAKQPTIIEITTAYASQSALNTNFTNILNAFNNTLSRDGSTPNQMEADIDMNSNDLLNVKDIVCDTITVDGVDLSTTAASVAAAAASAAAALVSENNAAASEANAAASEANVLAIEDALPDWQGAWLTATAYEVGDLVRDSGSSYICLVNHTSGTFATDLGAGKWELFAQKGDAGAGTGDMLGANNLSDVANAATSLSNIGGQPLNAGLTDIAGLTPTADNFIVGDGANWTQESAATARATLQAMYRQAATINSTDLETIADNGFYKIGTANTNGWPSMAQGDELLSIVWDVNSAIQIGFRKDTADPIAYYKVKVGGTWYAWEAQASQNYVDTAIAAIATHSEESAVTLTGASVDIDSFSSADSLEVFLDGASINTTDHLLLQFKVGGTAVTTGYKSGATSDGTGGHAYISRTDGFAIIGQSAAYAHYAVLRLDRIPGSNKWLYSYRGYRDGTTLISAGSGWVSLAGAITGIRLTTTNSGSATFDAGEMSVRWR